MQPQQPLAPSYPSGASTSIPKPKTNNFNQIYATIMRLQPSNIIPPQLLLQLSETLQDPTIFEIVQSLQKIQVIFDEISLTS